MPAIRDSAFSLHATATLRSLEVPMPAYTTGDLLVAMMTADTGTTQVWKGGNPVDGCKRDAATVFTDYLTAANNATAGDVVPWSAGTPAVNDAFYIGNNVPFTDAFVKSGTQGVQTATMVWEYWNGAWTALAGVTDNTTSLTLATTFPLNVTYTMPTDWATTTVSASTLYWIRLRITAFTSMTTHALLSQVWVCEDGPSGWKQFDSTSNTANLGWLFKTATASEVDTTFFYTIQETVNGLVISIRDVDPIADSGPGAQTITVAATAKTFTRTAGSFVTNGFVAGMNVTTSGHTNGGNNGRKVIATVTATVMTMTVATGLVDETGNANERVISSPFDGAVGIAKSTTSSAKANMPTITTIANNCLLLYGCSLSTVGVPSIIEGAGTLLVGKDGGSHSDACSWSIQGTAGATPSTVGMSNLSAAAAQLAVVAITPPAATTSGTVVVPGYCAADSSVYVTPFTAAAYNGDSAPATTFTTPFTGTIDGRTLGAAASVAALPDSGINTFHALTNVTGTTTADRYDGIRQTIVARTNLGSKNILFHIQPTTPIAIQTTDSVTLAGARGVIIGLASTASNFKAYHVSGGFNSWGVARTAPVVINTSYAGAGLLQTTGTFDPASITEIGFAISAKTTAAAWSMGSIWALDTCTIAGGSTAEPLDMEGIIRAYADGHERKSAIRQGKGQGLFLGPIQIGDGGTSPVKLGLDATAMEFPRQYNKALREVYYLSTDNFAGLIYYPGASDIITHTNSVVSAPSRYKWGLHASASASASYNFDGLNVIGAGTITLNKAITISGLTINDYSTLNLSGATFTAGIIKNMPTTNDSITTSSTTVISSSAINTTTVTAGNRWASLAFGDVDIFATCAFTGSATSGHAIRITSAGTITFSGNTFTSYGPAARSFNTSSSGIANSTDIITLDAAHGYSNGDPIYYQDQGGVQTVGLTDGNLYYARSETSTSISTYDTAAHAIAGGATGLTNLTAAGSETHYIYSAGAAIYNNSGGAVTINITNAGSSPSIRNSDGSSTTVESQVTFTVTVKDLETGAVIPNARVMVPVTSGAYFPYLASVTIVSSGTTATVTHTGHGRATNDNILIAGANEDEYNGAYAITKIDANTYTYTMLGDPASPATGTITATMVLLNGLTNASGVITDSRTYSAEQPVSGWVRKATGSPLYKQAPVADTVSNTAGLSVTVFLQPDE